MVASTAIDAVRVGSSEVAAIYLGADSVWTANKPGYVLLTPTSIAYSGTSASVGANGQVTFSAVTSLSLNGVFTADFDNYVVSMSLNGSNTTQIEMKLRAAGTDSSSNYTLQYISVDSTSVTAARTTSASSMNCGLIYSQPNGISSYVYGPFIAQQTAMRSVTTSNYFAAYIQDFACTHSTLSSYDGITIIPTSANITGKLTVMGVRS